MPYKVSYEEDGFLRQLGVPAEGVIDSNDDDDDEDDGNDDEDDG